MASTFSYDELVSRNNGYISNDIQAKMRETRLLIAGCGIGSSLAVCAARMGFEKFVLVDGDTVDRHNLNRQFYGLADVGKPKVLALADEIKRINPNACTQQINAYLTSENTIDIVAKSDIVFDTVDFLDLPGILLLHSSAARLHKPIFTALSVGFGALVWYFPADAQISLQDIIAPDAALASEGGKQATYANVFASFVERIAPYLDAEVVQQIGTVLKLMEDGKPCPASQVAVGSFAIGAMAMSMIHDLIAGNPLPAAPKLIIHSFKKHHTTVVDLART